MSMEVYGVGTADKLAARHMTSLSARAWWSFDPPLSQNECPPASPRLHPPADLTCPGCKVVLTTNPGIQYHISRNVSGQVPTDNDESSDLYPPAKTPAFSCMPDLHAFTCMPAAACLCLQLLWSRLQKENVFLRCKEGDAELYCLKIVMAQRATATLQQCSPAVHYARTCKAVG
jgi:hypothetical protein